jgi:hypothetical protein
MLPVPPYKPGKYPPSTLFPRFGDSGTIPPQFRQQNEHLQAMIARRKASQQLLADRAPPQAERPGGDQYFDADEEEPAQEVPAEPGELDDMPLLEEVPAQMPGPQDPRDDEAPQEPVGVRPVELARQVQHASQWVGFGGGAVVRGLGNVLYYGGHAGLGLAQGAVQAFGGPRARTPRSPSPQDVAYDAPARAERRADLPQPAPKSRAAPAQFRIDTPEQNTSASASSTQVPRPRAGRRSPPPRADPNTSASSFSGSHRGPGGGGTGYV